MNILDLDGQIEATFILPPLLTGIPQSQVPEDIKCESLVFGSTSDSSDVSVKVRKS